MRGYKNRQLHKLKSFSFISFLFLLFLLSVFVQGCNFSKQSKQEKQNNSSDFSKIVVFSGIVSKPALEEAAKEFEEENGLKVELHFGGSGEMLSQMITTKKGDLYIPASSDFLGLAEKKGVVERGKKRIIAYLVPGIFVQKGNPQEIRSLLDLAKPNIRLAIANPEAVAVGRISLKTFREAEEKENQSGLSKAIEKNIVAYGRNAEETANILSLGQVDAIINWSIYEHWYKGEIELIPLDAKYISETSSISLALSKYSKNPKAAQEFVTFLTSGRGKAIYKKYGYQVKKGLKGTKGIEGTKGN